MAMTINPTPPTLQSLTPVLDKLSDAYARFVFRFRFRFH